MPSPHTAAGHPPQSFSQMPTQIESQELLQQNESARQTHSSQAHPSQPGVSDTEHPLLGTEGVQSPSSKLNSSQFKESSQMPSASHDWWYTDWDGIGWRGGGGKCFLTSPRGPEICFHHWET